MTGDPGGWVDESLHSSGDGRPRTLGRRVFISYSTRDGKAAADSLVKAIESEGVACWIAPRDIHQGVKWAQFIERSLCDSAALVVVVSPGANTSEWCYREVDAAIRHGIPLWWTGLSHAVPADNLSLYLGVIHGDPLESLDIRKLVRGLEARGRSPLQRLGLPPGGVDQVAVVRVQQEAEAARQDGQYDLADRRFDDVLAGVTPDEHGSEMRTVCVLGRAFSALQSGDIDEASAIATELGQLAVPVGASAVECARQAARLMLLRQALAL